MAFKFPFTNYHELNLTWVLDQLKALFEKSEENVTTIETYEGRLSTVEAEIPVITETASEASLAAAAAGTLSQTAKTTADTAQNNAIQAQGLAGTARQEAQAAQTAANEATQAAQQAQATAQNFDGRITQAENDSSQALEASRSFENRVQSAITTANNANQTATNAQGIAMRADQNAGTALDKIGDLSDLTTTAKQNLVAAINEAAQSGGGGGGGGGAVSSVNGKTGAVVLDAGDLGFNSSATYNSGTVGAELSDQKNAIGQKQTAPSSAGTAGQVLGLDNSLQPVWVNQSGGGSTNQMELLKVVVLDSDAQSVVIDTDDRSESFSLGNFVLLVKSVGASGSTTEGYLKICLNSSKHTVNRIADVASAIRKAGSQSSISVVGQLFEGFGISGTIVKSDTKSINTDGSFDLIRTYNSGIGGFSFSPQRIYSVFVGTDKPSLLLGAGSVIALYGVRK